MVPDIANADITSNEDFLWSNKYLAFHPEAETRADVEVYMNLDFYAKADMNADTNASAVIEIGRNFESDAEADKDVNTDASADIDIGKNLECDAEADTDADTDVSAFCFPRLRVVVASRMLFFLK